MKEKRLENVCRELLMYVEKGYTISEEKVLGLSESLAFFDGREERMPSSYVRLRDEIDQRWQYREIEQLTVEELFIIGSIWGCLRAAESRRRCVRDDILEQRQWEILLNKYKDKDKVWFINTISSQPGIRHKDLAEKSKKSPSQMSQMMSGIIKDGLVSCNYAGREKFYFVSELGKKLSRQLAKQKREENLQKLSSNILCVGNNEERKDNARLRMSFNGDRPWPLALQRIGYTINYNVNLNNNTYDSRRSEIGEENQIWAKSEALSMIN